MNTDDARELFPAYRADRSRAGLVQRPATELSERVYARLLDAGRGKGGTVIFLAGGSGSGKTTALRRMMRERPLDDPITFDGTFADHAADLRRIRHTLNQGYESVSSTSMSRTRCEHLATPWCGPSRWRLSSVWAHHPGDRTRGPARQGASGLRHGG